MNRTRRFLKPRIINSVTGLAMAAMLGWFSYKHIIAFKDTSEWIYLLLCISEIISTTFFIFRTQPTSVSTDPLDWLFAIAGSFLPLFLTPSDWGIMESASNLVLPGLVLQILGLISLNRSFAIVAALRQVKTNGMYGLVRHPLYASYFLMFTGYILSNTTLINFVIYSLTVALLIARIVREERHLLSEFQYSQYMKRVRYRLIPFVF